MAKATFLQRGEALDYKNETNTIIEANTVIALAGARIGIAGTDILPKQIGDVHVSGVFEIKKTAEKEIEMGQDVYFDGEGITDEADGNTPAGFAASAAESGADVVEVKIG